GEETAPTPPVMESIGPYLDSAEQLGIRTAELHDALAAGTSEDFVPEPFTSLYQRSLFQSLRTKVHPTMVQVRRMLPELDEPSRASAEALLEAEGEILERFDA